LSTEQSQKIYSPVFWSWPTTSGSPPVFSISFSAHSFSALFSSLDCTLAHSRPLWRSMFFSKRVFSVLSSSSRCFFERVMLDIVLTYYSMLPRDPSIEDDRFEYEPVPPSGLFEISRRRTWPFHIHNPVMAIRGRNTYRVGKA